MVLTKSRWLLLIALFLMSGPIHAQVSEQTNDDSSESKASKKRAPKKHVLFITFADKKKAQQIRNKTIKSIRELLGSTKDKSRRYELLRRYGELYVEQAEYALEKEIRLFEAQYQRWEKTKKGKEPLIDHTNSNLSLKKAVKIYSEIVENYSDYPGVDITFYELGKTLLMLNNKMGLHYLERLLSEHPSSAYIPEALFSMGDYWFDHHDMVKAKNYYQKAAKFKNHHIYPYAIYKLGWTYYNYPAETKVQENAKFKKSITAFKLVIHLSDKLKKTNENQAIFLRQEAINDLIMVWADTEDVKAAWAYFKKIGDQEAFYRMLERLGGIYIEQGKNQKAIMVYSRILKERPLRDSNFTNHAKLVDLFQVTGKYKLVVKHLKAMARFYTNEGKWAKAHQKNKDLLEEAYEKVEKTYHRLATTYHKAAQQQKRQTLFAVASLLYAGYLESFPKEEKTYELRYFLADTLYEQKKFDQAATQYFKVVSLKRKNGKYLHDAALNAVISMNNVVSDTDYPDLPKKGEIKKPMEIPKSKTKLRRALDLYVELFPKRDEARPMEVTAAKITYDYGHYDDAIKRLKKIALSRAGTSQSKESVKLILAHFKNAKDWDNTIAYSRLFLDTKEVLKGKLAESTLALLKFSLFERALALEKNKKPLEAATAFLAYQKEFPKEKNSPDAIYNAMVIYFNEGQVSRALETAKQVLSEYPSYKRKPDIVIAISETYEGLAEFANAASFYALFAKLYPKDRRSPESLFNSAILYKGAGNFAQAVRHFEQFIANYPGHKLQLKAHLEMAELQESSKDLSSAITTYNQIITKFPKVYDEFYFAQAKLATLDTSKKNPYGNPKQLKKLGSELAKRKSIRAIKARELTANALFMDLNDRFKMFVTSKIKVSNNNIEQALKLKQDELLSLANQYEKIIAIEHPETVVASHYRLGQSHEAFSLAISTLEPPKEFRDEEKKQIRSSLENLAKPLRQEAYKFYENAFEHSKATKVFTVWGARAYERMSLIDEKKSPQVKEFQVAPGYISHSISYDQSVATILN